MPQPGCLNPTKEAWYTPPGPVWTDTENLIPTGIRSPDNPARSVHYYAIPTNVTLHAEYNI
jgi:hypothetical protein